MRRTRTWAASRSAPRSSRSLELDCRPMADCQLCGSHHKEDICPQARTGQVIDNYVVGTLLGVGGIAAVYNARHLKLGREIAIKVLHKRWANDHELASRFVRE